MEPTSIIPKLLRADTKAVEECIFLADEEAAMRHRLELKVERALYRTAVALQEARDRHEHSCDYSLNYFWRNEDRVKIEFEQATVALGELRDRQLYRSSHRCFDHYYRQRFGSFVEDYLPVPHPDSPRLSISGQ